MRYAKPLTAVTLCVLSSTGLAAPQLKGAKKAAPMPMNITCAVEPEDKVKVQDATKAKLYADYKGNRYFFCCSGCPLEFQKNPAKFAKNAHIKTPVVRKVNAKTR